MNRLIMILVVFVFTFDVGYSQNTTKKDSSDVSQRESLNGAFIIDNKFCDLLEEFLDVVETDPFKPLKSNYIVTISNSYNCKDSLYNICFTIEEPYQNEILSDMVPQKGYLYVYGGKLKGKHIFIKQKSFFGTLVRSEFNFIDKINDIDSLTADGYRKKAKDFNLREIMTDRPQSMNIVTNDREQILNITYSTTECFTKHHFEDISKYKTWIKNKRQEILQNKKY